MNQQSEIEQQKNMPSSKYIGRDSTLFELVFWTPTNYAISVSNPIEPVQEYTGI